MVALACPSCGATVNVFDDLLGSWVQCGTCSASFAAMASPESPSEEDLRPPRRPAGVYLLASGCLAGLALLVGIGIGASSKGPPAPTPRAETDDAPRLREPASKTSAIAAGAPDRPSPLGAVRESVATATGVPEIAEDPQMVRILDAVLKNPWWDKTVGPAEFNGVLDMLTSRGEGVVFINKQASAVWLSPATLGFHGRGLPEPSFNQMLSVEVMGKQTSPAVRALGEPRLTVFLLPPRGLRYGRRRAANLVQEALDLGDSLSRQKKNAAQWDEFFKMKRP